MRSLFLTVLLLAASTMPANAYVPEKTPARDAERHARRLANPNVPGRPLPGIVVARGAARFVSINATRPFIPASLTKLATTTAAIARFGRKHRFQTRAFASDGGASVRTLTLVGGGDPTFATQEYRRGRFLPKATDAIKRPAFATDSPTVEQLAREVKRSGVRVVTGDLLVDESLFDTRRTPAGWRAAYTGSHPDSGYLSALSLNEGRGDVDGETILSDNAMAAGRALRAALREIGVRVEGTVRRGRRAGGTRPVGSVRSPPLSQIVDFIDRYSVNYPAEILLKHLGARFGKAGSSAAGVAVVRRTLANLGVDVSQLTLTDGSGLSIRNRTTPAMIADLLGVITTREGKDWDALRAAMPVAGHPGTLQRRMRGTPAAGNLRGKTGQLRGVRAMAGWVTGRDGLPIVYVAMFNAAPQPFALTEPIDRFGVGLTGLPGS